MGGGIFPQNSSIKNIVAIYDENVTILSIAGLVSKATTHCILGFIIGIGIYRRT